MFSKLVNHLFRIRKVRAPFGTPNLLLQSPVVECSVRQRRLAVVFSSVNANSFSFYNLFRPKSNFFVVFVRDPFDCWFGKGAGDRLKSWKRIQWCISTIRRDLRIEQTLAFGSSMGGYAALRLAAELDFDYCVATSPQTILDPRLPHTPKLILGDSLFDIKPLIEEAKKTQFHVYFGGIDLVDIYNVDRISWPLGTVCQPLVGQDHLAAVFLQRGGFFSRMVASFANAGTVECLSEQFGGPNCVPIRANFALISDIVGVCLLEQRGNIGSLLELTACHQGNWAGAFHLASCSMQAKGYLETALIYSKTAVELAPKSIALNDQLACVLLALGYRSDAKTVLERSLILRPKHYFALCSLAEILSDEGDVDKSYMLLDKAIAMRPRLTRAQELRMHLDRKHAPSGR